ncbi:hypothetical protein LDENG_00070420 [Lucifuga dentata]|nr:hypothetical protein LDENG_00070420 [Lucifuga dentata]
MEVCCHHRNGASPSAELFLSFSLFLDDLNTWIFILFFLPFRTRLRPGAQWLNWRESSNRLQLPRTPPLGQTRINR